VKFDLEQEKEEKDTGLQVEVPDKEIVEIRQKIDYMNEQIKKDPEAQYVKDAMKKEVTDQ
jgi:hypothetical protein